MSNLSTNQKRAILICSGIVVLLCTFFFLFQRNMDTVTSLERETSQYRRQVNFLSNLQMQVNEMRETTPVQQKEIDTYTKEFPCKVPQQKAIYNIWKMMSQSGVDITAIKPGKPQTFLNAGKFVTLDSTDTAAGETEQAATGSAVEANPETQVTVDQMVGKVSAYEVELTGTMSQIMKSLDWVTENKERMAVSSINLSFDASAGKLTGAVIINFYEMNGNGKAYEEPNISGITIGTDSIFGILKK